MADAGIGEAMLIGAAIGAGSGAAAGSAKGGDNVWKGALMGGALGAAGGGIGGALAPEAAVAADAAAPALTETAAAAAAPTLGEASAMAAPEVVEGGIAALPTGATALPGAESFGASQATGATALPGSGSFGGSGAATITDAGGASGSLPTGAASFPGGGSFGGSGGATVGETGGFASSGGGAGGVGGAGGQTPADPTFLDKYGTKLAFAGGTLGLGALMNQDQKKYGIPQNEPYNGPLSQFHYSPSGYTPTYATPRVYKAHYADGGIAQLSPSPSMMSSGKSNVDFMGGDMYPQSQLQQSHYSTPSQMPTSAQQAMASYEPSTNPLTGEPTTHMASGGVARYGVGGDIAKGLTSMQPGGFGGDFANKLYATTHLGGFMGDLQEEIAPGGTLGEIEAAGIPGRAEWLRRKREGQAQASFATGGGIASLGGYSDGGQLLRGPGDGVSDSIPASIGGKQPARLADGEFVIPARIVSEIGNGSTDAGAKQLYGMMDRIQKRRGKTTGKNSVAKNTRSYKELPA